MELFYFPASAPCRGVIWFLDGHPELNAKVKRTLIDMKKNEHLSPEYYAENFYQTVPMLKVSYEEDGKQKFYALTESGAILQFLSDQVGGVEQSERGDRDPLSRARVIEAQLHHDSLARQVSNTHRAAFNTKRAKPETSLADMRSLVGKGMDDLRYALNLLEKVLATQTYIAGNAFTLADYTVAAELSRLVILKNVLPDGGVQLETEYPNIVRYVDLLSKRPGWTEFVAPLGPLAAVCSPSSSGL